MLSCRRKALSVILQVLAILGLLAVLVDSAQASSPVVLDGRAGDVDGRGHMAIFRDPEGTRTLDEIIGIDAAGRFKPIPGNVGLGYTPDTIWLRMDLVLPEGAPERWLLEVMPSYLDHLDLYLLPRRRAARGDGRRQAPVLGPNGGIPELSFPAPHPGGKKPSLSEGQEHQRDDRAAPLLAAFRFRARRQRRVRLARPLLRRPSDGDAPQPDRLRHQPPEHLPDLFGLRVIDRRAFFLPSTDCWRNSRCPITR